MAEYRIKKRYYRIGIEDEARPPECCEVITRYEVEVKSIFFWHYVKGFKRLISAVRLLQVLNEDYGA